MKRPAISFLLFSTFAYGDGNSMRRKGSWFAMSGMLAVLAVVFILPTGVGAASKYKLLHAFHTYDGAGPNANLIFDTAGNLYTTTSGGGSGHGTVIKLAPNPDGKWTESVLYEFTGGQDGSGPYAGLIFDQAGNLYGTTQFGGKLGGCNGLGCGVVFTLTPNPDGSWTERVLYSFTGGKDGGNPLAGLIFDAAGNLYDTTLIGGNLNCDLPPGCGVVFTLTPNPDGSWTEKVLHKFTGGKDGGSPYADLVFDTPELNLYGTTARGGNLSGCSGFGCGVVFTLTPNPDGSWTEKVLHKFTGGKDGSGPSAGLIFDRAGNLYGTTGGGGNLNDCGAGCGVVFRLTPNPNGSWTEKVLHKFTGEDGENPSAALIFDTAGNLYGTTFYGGNLSGCNGPGGCGVVFRLTPNPDGSWTEKVLHQLTGTGGAFPTGSLIFDTSGNLYGSASECTMSRCQGVVFEITP